MKNRIVRIRLLLALTALLAALACLSAQAEDAMGKPLADFSVQTIDGGTFTLSEALKDHDMVLINLWASWCGPCGMEFPYLEEAYGQYADRVAVIALSIEPKDTVDVLRQYAEEHGMTFPVGSDIGVGLADTFGVVSIPTSVVVDRFGNVALVEAGAQTGTLAFTALFDHFLDESYTETAVLDGFPAPRPVEGASGKALADAANAEGGELAFRNAGDPSVWPMLPAEIDGRTVLVSSNSGVDNSASAVCYTAEANEGDALAFDFRTSLEKAFDALYVRVDSHIVKRFTGIHDWTSWALPLEAGEHEIALGCVKDVKQADGEDCAWIDDVRIATGEAAQALIGALPEYPSSDEFSLTLTGPEMREAAFDDEQNVVSSNFMVDGGWIVDGDRVTARVTLTADQDPETAFISTTNGEVFTLAEAGIAGDGYEFDLSLDSDIGAFIYAYPGPTAEEANGVQAALALAGERGMSGFIDYLASYGYEVDWHYVDGAGEAEAEASD